MKKIYKIAIVVSVAVSLLLFCCFGASAEHVVEGVSNGWNNVIQVDQLTFHEGVDMPTINVSNAKLPYERGLFHGSNEYYVVAMNNGDLPLDTRWIHIPAGYTFTLQFKMYLNYRINPYSDFVSVPQKYMQIRGMFCNSIDQGHFNVDGTIERGDDQGTYRWSYLGTLRYENNTGQDMYLSSVSMGMIDSIVPEYYSCYMNVNKISYRVLSSTDTIISNQNDNTDKIIGEIQDSTDQITDEIQDSTDQITGEIQDSTDQITNGWDKNPSSPDGADEIGDVHDTEEELLEQQQPGIDGFGGIFNSFSNYLTENGDGITFVSGILQHVLDLDSNTFLVRIVFFSLAIGLVAFLLNIAPTLVAKMSRRW